MDKSVVTARSHGEGTSPGSLVSMQDLFKRLNAQGIDLKISNFSKASKKRDTQVFLDIIYQLKRELRRQKGERKARSYFPIDSTIIS